MDASRRRRPGPACRRREFARCWRLPGSHRFGSLRGHPARCRQMGRPCRLPAGGAGGAGGRPHLLPAFSGRRRRADAFAAPAGRRSRTGPARGRRQPQSAARGTVGRPFGRHRRMRVASRGAGTRSRTSPQAARQSQKPAYRAARVEKGNAMLGLMQDRPLLISQIIDFAAAYYPDVEIVTRTVEGPIQRYGYREAAKRAKQLAEALQGLGIKLGDRVGTIAWNTYRHFELYFGISGIGAVLHTINPRLAPEHVAYIANHAEDQIIFVDLNLLPIVEGVWDKLKTVKHVVLMTDRAHMPASSKIPNLLCYEELIADKPGALKWPDFDERTASSLCYTSGTTGNPKGVLYSHRSTLIHSMMMCSGPVLGLDPDSTILPVVPMFHANAWGLVYAGPICGTKLVFPGPKLDGASIYELLDKEKVTLSAGVPTGWLALLDYCQQNKLKMSSVRRTLSGGSAVPISMTSRFWKEHEVE